MSSPGESQSSSSALRCQRYRDRKRNGILCCTVELDERILKSLVDGLFLSSDYSAPENRHAAAADIKGAVELLLDAFVDNGIEVSDEWVEKISG